MRGLTDPIRITFFTNNINYEDDNIDMEKFK